MKKIIALFCLLIVLTACKSKSKTVEKSQAVVTKFDVIESDKIDFAQKKKAYDLGKRVLMTCNTSRFKAFTTSEATQKVIENTTQARLTKTCLKFRLKYGDFIDLKLVEVLRPKNSKNTIYRYKALYEKKIANKELRVTMDEDNKISALKSTDWVEKFEPLQR